MYPSHFACILHVSQTSPRYILGYTSNTSRYMYLGRFLGVTLDTCQDTSRYITIRVSWTLHQDTSGYTEIQNHDTCILDASLRIYVGYMQGFMRDTCGIHVSAVVPGYIEDTCGIHQGYIMRDMYLKCMQRGTYLRCKIHARYMQDTCILRGDQDTYRIHPRYIVRYMQDTCISNASGDRCI